MGIIRAVNLIFDYIRHDEETDKDEVSHALRGVNLDIEEGSFVAILGHNGSGKSTFAKLMNGILLPSDGTVYISDMKTSDEEHLWDVRKTAGMVFQNPDNQIIGRGLWTGKYGRAHRRDLEAGGPEPGSRGNDGVPSPVAQ